jgi:transcription initiation factor TFIIB
MGNHRALNTSKSCPECGGDPTRSGEETICESCGLVLDEHRTTSTPSLSNEGGPSENRLLPGKGLTTKFESSQHSESELTKLPGRRGRLRRWQHRIRQNNSQERNLDTALNEITRISSALGIPDVTQETATIVYKRALDDGLIVGWSIEAIATASILVACRQDSLPESLTDVASVSKVSERKIGRARRHLDQELNLSIPPSTPLDFIPRYCSELEVSQAVENRARTIIENTSNRVLSGSSPCGLAGAAVYVAAYDEGEPVDQEAVSSVADVAVNTVSRQSQALSGNREQ